MDKGPERPSVTCYGEYTEPDGKRRPVSTVHPDQGVESTRNGNNTGPVRARRYWYNEVLDGTINHQVDAVDGVLCNV